MRSASDVRKLTSAIPFWLTLLIPPLVGYSLFAGGWTVLIVPLYIWILMGVLDSVFGLDLKNANPDTPDSDLFWYRLVTLIWFPLQFIVVFGGIWILTSTTHLGFWESFAILFGIGITSGTVGINYAHELMHQKSKIERWLADLQMTMVLYGHFRSEHLLVHHL